MSIAHYYFNEINDCIENLEHIAKERMKLLAEEKENKNIFQFKDEEDEEDKAQVAEAESFLQKLLDENRLTLPQVQELFKKLQKASTNANSKKIADFRKDLSDFIQDKPEIKEYLEKSESNQSILIKAAQKISSKSQPKPTQENAQNSNQTQEILICLLFFALHFVSNAQEVVEIIILRAIELALA